MSQNGKMLQKVQKIKVLQDGGEYEVDKIQNKRLLPWQKPLGG